MKPAKRCTALLVAAALVALGSCDEKPRTGDGGPDGRIPSGKCTAGVDRSVDTSTAIPLTAGQEATDYICPVGDNDYYKVTVPAGDKLLRVNVMFGAAITNVKLTYLVLDASGKAIASAPAGDGKSYNALHCLPPGDYFVLIQDEGNDAQDGTNQYKLSYTTEKDPDTAEDNNDFGAAKPIQGSASGYISCTTDLDFFTVTVGADQLLEVKLTTSGATPVDVKYSLYDQDQKWIGDQVNPDGTRGPADLTTIHAVPKAGTYYIKVEDDNSDEADPKVAYTLAVTTRDEQDPNDKGTRNDTPATATSLGAGPNVDRTISGQIASKADVDYYKIDGMADVNINNPAVIEVTLTYNGPAEMEPAIALVYGDPESPCTKDTCCRVLNPAGPGCNNMMDCAFGSFNCIDKGDTFCADNECAPGAGTGCAMERRCAGAAVCLPGGRCGAEQVVRFDDNPKDEASVRTAQPLIHPGPWYVRVTDHKNDEYEYGKNYSLTVRTRMDPDGAKEINSAYFPVLVPTNLETMVRNLHVEQAKAKGTTITLPATISGYISYEGDQDWFVFANPCPGAECTMVASFSTSGNCPGGAQGAGLEFVYMLLKKNGDPKDSFPKSPTPGQSGSFGGSANCWLNRDSGDYLFSIADYKHNNWSWDCQYTVNISIAAQGCPQPPCAVYNGTCYVP